MTEADYIEESLACSLSDLDITLNSEIISAVAGDIAGAMENYGTAMGHDCIPNPLAAEVDRVKQEARRAHDEDEGEIRRLEKVISERNKEIDRVLWALEESRQKECHCS